MIYAAAIRYMLDVGPGPITYTLPPPARHSDIISLIHKDLGEFRHTRAEQGFLDDAHGFVDRVTAGASAIVCGQVDALSVSPNLYSEDLW